MQMDTAEEDQTMNQKEGGWVKKCRLEHSESVYSQGSREVPHLQNQNGGHSEFKKKKKRSGPSHGYSNIIYITMNFSKWNPNMFFPYSPWFEYILYLKHFKGAISSIFAFDFFGKPDSLSHIYGYATKAC